MSRERFVSFTPGSEAAGMFGILDGRSDAANDRVLPGTECLVLEIAGRPVARAGLWIAEGLAGTSGASGLIGHYEAVDAHAGTALLREACARLAGRGAGRVLAPMNGSTWMRYRLALPAESIDTPHTPEFFAGEPQSPPEYPQHLDDADFAIVSRYESRLEVFDAARPRGGEGPAPTGDLHLRPLDPGRFDDELVTLHALSLDAFRDNPFYAPIDLPAFRALYEPFRGRFDPGLVSIAEGPEGPVGYMFTYLDPGSLQGGRPLRVILKTLAVARAARGRGVGSMLMDGLREAARVRGVRTAIYALMHVDNVSRAMSTRRSGILFRRYALWQWTP